MGDQAAVPIEPTSQTQVLEESLTVDGVLLAGVPGAGGYDAICCVIADDGEGDGSTFQQLLEVWKREKVPICPLLAREERSGIRFEETEAFLA
jgi:phosphomevalonate kinase